MSTPLTIYLDSPQVRLKSDTLSTLVSGHDWDPTTWGSAFGSWVEPVGRRAMLEPAPINGQWTQSSSGIFSKWTGADFTLMGGYASTLGGGNAWCDDNTEGGGPYMLYNSSTGNTSNVGGYTNFNLPLNQPVCFEMFVPDGVPANYPIVNLGISASIDGSTGVSMQIFGGGSCNVYKNGAPVGNYSLSGDLFGYYDANQNTFGAAPKGWLRLVIIPCSDRELLVVCPTFGGGFSHVFLDLEEGIAGQTILNAAPFCRSDANISGQSARRSNPVRGIRHDRGISVWLAHCSAFWHSERALCLPRPDERR